MEWIVFGVVIVIAVILLKGFDRIAGRGPKQVRDGINASDASRKSEGRVPCPECSEMILPTAKRCPFCRSEI